MEINDKNDQKKLKEDFYGELGLIGRLLLFCKSPFSRPIDAYFAYDRIKPHFIGIENIFRVMDKKLKSKVWWDYFSLRNEIFNLSSKINSSSMYNFSKDFNELEKNIYFDNETKFINKVMGYDIDEKILKENNTKENNTKENNTKENNTKENNTKENNTKENNTKENVTKENNTKENDTKENVTKENGAKENITKENNTKKSDAKENITKENITKENNAKENNTKENDTKENDTKENDTKENDTKENDTKENDMKENDAKENVTKENITNESKQPEDFESITKHIEKLISEQNITTKKIDCYNYNIPILLKHYGHIKDEIIQYQSKLNNLIDKINR